MDAERPASDGQIFDYGGFLSGWQFHGSDNLIMLPYFQNADGIRLPDALRFFI